MFLIQYFLKKNIIKRLKFNYYPFDILISYLNHEYSEDIKYLILSQKYISSEHIALSNSIEELIGQVIKKFCAEDILYYAGGYKPSDSGYYRELNGVFMTFIYNILVEESILHNSLNRTKKIATVRIDNFIKKIEEFRYTNEYVNKFYDIHLYDLNKWIETFDCIEWNPS